QLVIVFEEHKPAAYWGNFGLLSEQGVLFIPQYAVTIPDLPTLEGPEGRSNSVWQQYLEMKKMLAPLQLHITHITLAPRGAWQLRLSNGTTIVLGTHDVLPRLHRFIRVYNQHLCEKQAQLAYVDLRYTSGMAVGWK
ncbi:MAG TPA: cell division protein FtsQ/DivIB, partial [Candidatus Berkiella sp.]|nr:cell division protein FtsQ/DivIB [Candidatus Berkiella sp.]